MNRKYTEEHKQFIRGHATGRRFPELTEMFNTHFGTDYEIKSVKNLVYRIGLKNGLNDGSGLTEMGKPYRFKKGHVPFNKGKKGECAKGCEKTWFKKGNKSHNWVPLGSERITKDDYVQIKIQDGQLQKNWRGKHILIWEEVNGSLPKGHAIIFGDGDKRNFDIDNLICVTRGQLARLNQNGLIQNDAELTKMGIVVADVITKISERRKQN